MGIEVSSNQGVFKGGEVFEAVCDGLGLCGMVGAFGVSRGNVNVGYVKVMVLVEVEFYDLVFDVAVWEGGFDFGEGDC